MAFGLGVDRGVQNRGVREIHDARLGATRGPFQLQDGHIVGRGGAEDGGGDKKGHLRASGGPVPAQIKAVNPDLPLQTETYTSVYLVNKKQPEGQMIEKMMNKMYKTL